MEKKRVAFDADPGLVAAAREAAAREDRTLSSFIRVAMQAAIEQTQPERAA